MNHIVLLGDSIFDNRAYVGNSGKDVITHLKEIVPNDWESAIYAIDGSLVENVSSQLLKISPDATHIFVSAGGNNAIMNADILQMKANSSAEVFNALSNRVNDFEFQYREMLKKVLSRNLPTAVCTIYYPNFPESVFQKLAVAALSSFNDVIIKHATLNNIPILDLRLICNEKDDYANEIEPSDKGGRKIASKIVDMVENHNFLDKMTSIYY